MHIPKLLAVFSLAAFCAGTLHAQRPDSDLQAQAREQLRKAMQGDTSPVTAPSNTPPAAVVAKPPAQPPSTPAPVLAAPPATVAPPTQLPVRSVRTEPQVSPQEQIRTMELQRQEALKSASTVPAVLSSPVTAPMSMTMQTTMSAATPGKTLSPEEQEKAREAVRKQMEQLDAKTPSAPVVTAPPPAKPVMTAPTTVKTTPPQVQTAPPAVKTVATPAPATGVTTAPPVMGTMPASGSKEARLADLLQQYKAGSISPMEYQERRAKIRAEPDKQ